MKPPSPAGQDQPRPPGPGLGHIAGFLRRMSPAKVVSGLRLLLSGDLRAFRKRLAAQSVPRRTERLDLVILPLSPPGATVAGAAPSRDWEPIVVRPAAAPAVSLIIPVRDGWNRTHACIRSIVAAEPDLDYEIILADDASGDDTRFATRWVEGLSIVRSDRQQGLRAAAVSAAARARGGHLCFLLGGPQVQAGSVGAMHSLLRRRQDAGLVGAKVVLPDGRLGEAGSTVHADGRVEPRGLHGDPLAPEFSWVRECDAFAGTAVMVPAPVWNRLGGFHDDYATISAALVDFAFRVREAGLRTLLQPSAVIVRIDAADGIAAEPTDAGSDGARDRARFVAAWARCARPGAAPGRSRAGRSGDRNTVVVIDHHVPTPDRDAGSRTVFQYLRLAVDMGHDVKFLPADFDHDPGYRGLLEQEGIEILAGERMERGWRGWFREHEREIHAVLFCRPEATERFLDEVIRSCPRARRAYYGHDLHWIREERAYALTGDPAAARRAEDWKRRECRVIERMHCNLSISSEESRIVAGLLPNIDHVVFPVFYWDDLASLRPEDGARSGFLFVGGFAHRPNVDGLEWFLDEVWPLVRSRLPSATLHVAGSNAPREILERRDPGLTLHGFVDDRRLAELYRSSRVAVVPLRYGAGVKGKTVEAMRNGLPVVSTAIGIEGLPDLPSDLRGCDDPGAFASESIAAHEDRDRWMRQVTDQLAYVRGRFSRERAEQCLRLALEGPP